MKIISRRTASVVALAIAIASLFVGTAVQAQAPDEFRQDVTVPATGADALLCVQAGDQRHCADVGATVGGTLTAIVRASAAPIFETEPCVVAGAVVGAVINITGEPGAQVRAKFDGQDLAGGDVSAKVPPATINENRSAGAFVC
ncbi:MAG: hypothetical protein M3O70_14830 [Actinomycetota bacterium]|nr:hypothetical protein [Actinomycetota bacterium]